MAIPFAAAVTSNTRLATPAIAAQSDVNCPLFVDLDGSLLLTDTLGEMALHFIRTAPWRIVFLLAWLIRGRAYLKYRLAEDWTPNPATLPFNENLLDYLKEQARLGRRLVLATGAPERMARAVADHLGIFSDVLASSCEVNLSGINKRKAIQHATDAKFHYAGNSSADLAVWRHSSGAVLASAPGRIRQNLRSVGIPIVAEFPRPPRRLFRIFRAHQWVKNILIFLPILLSHRLLDLTLIWRGLIAFVAFSLLASAAYIVNDVLDLDSDRNHPQKKFRPFASGSAPLAWGIVIAIVLPILAMSISITLPKDARWFLPAYLVGTVVYSIKLKRMLFGDVLALAAFYTMRILFGGEAMHIQISNWTLLFFMFIFLSLALTKRLNELRVKSRAGERALPGRGYLAIDLAQIAGLAAASSYVSVLALVLYINSPDALLLYRHPRALWFICPLLIYWLSRFLLLANRGDMHFDPIVFAAQDRLTYVIMASIALVALFSI